MKPLSGSSSFEMDLGIRCFLITGCSSTFLEAASCSRNLPFDGYWLGDFVVYKNSDESSEQDDLLWEATLGFLVFEI